ncbi:MAG: UDP-N-acetylglucosamine 4,6-dehydratase [Pseudomonadota bacterium]|nr:UDP-N-acetylglucosamine 4,6-dehydratase [Pseudomonadota bacterium]
MNLLLDRQPIFSPDINACEPDLLALVSGARFLVIGGAGSIGQAVVKEIFVRSPAALHVVDINENNLVELVRDLRSSSGYIEGDFRTFCLDSNSDLFDAFFGVEGPYDYVLNLSALKHVRSEKDPFTLMRLLEVNILNTIRTVNLAASTGAKKYFCVSTDKAAGPVNLMGASKRGMELVLMSGDQNVAVSTARFANVAFSDGSLLHGFTQRLQKSQPLSAPRDIKRYFVSQQDAGHLCVMSCLLGANRDIFFPKEGDTMSLLPLHEIALEFLELNGYTPIECGSEDEARARTDELIAKKQWPCFFFDSNTTGEKPFEEFYLEGDEIDWDRFQTIGVIRHEATDVSDTITTFVERLDKLCSAGSWTKEHLVELIGVLVPELSHVETGRNLDNRM